MHRLDLKFSGVPLEDAEKAVVMIHGRGGTAEDILSLSEYLSLSDFALVAPEATGRSWYPNSFLAEVSDNEPWLTSALDIIGDTVDVVTKHGIEAENVYFLGFSQGACLVLEFVARNAKRYGGVVAFTGGLIGEVLRNASYSGDFMGTPFLLSTGDPDFHVPLSRVKESAKIIKGLNADVTDRVYKHRLHIISEDEVALANSLIFS